MGIVLPCWDTNVVRTTSAWIPNSTEIKEGDAIKPRRASSSHPLLIPLRRGLSIGLRRCAARSPREQSITSLARMGGGRKNRPGATATKLPIGLEGKAGDQIARCSTVLRREPWGGRPTMADHGV